METREKEPKELVEKYEPPEIIEMGQAEDLTQGGCKKNFENNRTRTQCNADF